MKFFTGIFIPVLFLSVSCKQIGNISNITRLQKVELLTSNQQQQYVTVKNIDFNTDPASFHEITGKLNSGKFPLKRMQGFIIPETNQSSLALTLNKLIDSTKKKDPGSINQKAELKPGSIALIISDVIPLIMLFIGILENPTIDFIFNIWFIIPISVILLLILTNIILYIILRKKLRAETNQIPNYDTVNILTKFANLFILLGLIGIFIEMIFSSSIAASGFAILGIFIGELGYVILFIALVTLLIVQANKLFR